MVISKIKQINKEIFVPGDKSISHRAIILGAISESTTIIKGFLMGADCLSTISCFRQLGIDIEITDTEVIVHGKGLKGLSKPNGILDVGNSGTTFRLLTGLLCGQSFNSKITGDESIQKRPMLRIVTPLREMGSNIIGKDNGNLCPLTITGSKLKGITYNMPIPSAQIKSSLLLASLYSEGQTIIKEPSPSRNHTELMMNYLGNSLEVNDLTIISTPNPKLIGNEILVPGDISSAAYFIVAGLITKDSAITIKNVGINPTRDGIISTLVQMGGNITYQNKRYVCGELISDINVKSSALKAITIEGDIIPKLIDEIPILAVAACFANGTTTIKDAKELKVKESNRIQTTVCELKKLGANIIETDDGMIITGGKTLTGCAIESYNDHRIAMAMAIAGITSSKTTTINNPECVQISFPGFFELLGSLGEQ